jgi:hypothetical protein
MTIVASYSNKAVVVVIQKVLEGLRQSSVGSADQQAGFIIRGPENIQGNNVYPFSTST